MVSRRTKDRPPLPPKRWRTLSNDLVSWCEDVDNRAFEGGGGQDDSWNILCDIEGLRCAIYSKDHERVRVDCAMWSEPTVTATFAIDDNAFKAITEYLQSHVDARRAQELAQVLR